MEEVRDEKLREELLALVTEKNRRQSETKQEEEKLINHKTRNGKLSEIAWGILVVIIAFANYLTFGPLAAMAVVILFALVRIIKLLEEIRKK
jgi:hypothetical protein